MSDELQQFTKEDFNPHVNSTFVTLIQLEEDEEPQEYSLTLTAVEGVGEKARDVAAHGRESFSLIFENPNLGMYLNQGLVSLTHEELGQLTLFLVPLGPVEDRMRYEVIFT